VSGSALSFRRGTTCLPTRMGSHPVFDASIVAQGLQSASHVPRHATRAPEVLNLDIPTLVFRRGIMKQKLIDHGSGLHVIAAAVLVALGSSAALAQEAGQQEADRPQTEQSQRQDPLSESRSQDTTQQESDISAAAGDTESGSSVLDQIAQEHEDLSTFVEAVKA